MNEIDLSGEEKQPQANPEGLTFISKEEADAKMEEAKSEAEVEAEAHHHVEPYPNECAYEAYQSLEDFREAFALVLDGVKYLPHLAKIARAVSNDRSDILDELSRAHARGRCRSQVEIDMDAEEAEAE